MAELDGCAREEVAVAAGIDRFGGWMLSAYGGAAIGALAYDVGGDVAEGLADAVPGALVCGVLGANPGNCVTERENDEDEAVYALLPAVGAAIDLRTGAVFARTPNPLRVDLNCR